MALGRAVQVDPKADPKVDSAWFQQVKLTHDEPRSNLV